MAETILAEVIGKLREAVVSLKKSSIYNEIVEPRDAVLARFQPVFSADNSPHITEDEFRSFLLLENNHHWSGLHRQGPRICSDMGKLRKALTTLLNEAEPVSERLDKAIEMVSGMGKNVASSILIVTQPDRYGVWNNRSEAAMKRLGIWPGFDRGESFGNRYVKVNRILLQLRDALQIDLWTLDALWWFLDQTPADDDKAGLLDQDVLENQPGFGLERHLHEFLRENWSHIEIGREWTIYKDTGDEEAGYEFPTSVGRIDLLAKHKSLPHWLVIELKRNQSSDQTIGQLLRYIGWVKRHLAADGEEVYGMIICRKADEALHYALITVPKIKLQLYRVEFHLKETEGLLGSN
jgi:hypothetical protein